ncbi:hypothetical protein Tco_1509631 [Tanacetum coccineum]
MQAARDRQKSYADLKRKPMEFQVGRINCMLQRFTLGKGSYVFCGKRVASDDLRLPLSLIKLDIRSQKDHRDSIITSILTAWMPEDPYVMGRSSGPTLSDYEPGLRARTHHFANNVPGPSMLMMRLIAKKHHMLRMPYPLLSHLTMSRSLILRRTREDDNEDPGDPVIIRR